ncbi:MAG: hypothetical protein EU551_03155 [Promethearchaeota archaeon]|nr:MAG: hypothetical protein EU551_03155 [Candidatus Lokiarchaeota archaeon]
MARKIIIKKLDHTGHSTMCLSMQATYNYINEEFDNGNLVYCPGLQKMFKNFASFMLEIGKIKEIVIIPPVVGG